MIQKDEELTLAQKVGKNLKVLIKQSIYKTQAKFAEAIGVAEVTVRRWIYNGVSDIDRIKDIADLLEVEIESLFK